MQPQHRDRNAQENRLQRTKRPWNAKWKCVYWLEVVVRLVFGVPLYGIVYGVFGAVAGVVVGIGLSMNTGDSSVMPTTVGLGAIIGVVSGALQGIVTACKTSWSNEHDLNAGC